MKQHILLKSFYGQRHDLAVASLTTPITSWLPGKAGQDPDPDAGKDPVPDPGKDPVPDPARTRSLTQAWTQSLT